MPATREADAYSMISNSDLSTKEGCFGKTVAGKIDVCSVLGERADVVIGGNGVGLTGAGIAVDVYPRAGKKVFVKVGAVAVAVNDELTPDANGLAKTAVSTNIVRGRAMFAANAGEFVEMHWLDAYIKP